MSIPCLKLYSSALCCYAFLDAASCRCSLHSQVLEDYAIYGDSVLGKWFVRDNGQKNPNVRTVFKPLLNMFHGERGSKRWKQVVDAKFKTATSVSGLIKVRQPFSNSAYTHKVWCKTTDCRLWHVTNISSLCLAYQKSSVQESFRGVNYPCSIACYCCQVPSSFPRRGNPYIQKLCDCIQNAVQGSSNACTEIICCKVACACVVNLLDRL